MRWWDDSLLRVQLLAQASNEVGDLAGAEEILRGALMRQPGEVRQPGVARIGAQTVASLAAPFRGP
jgi:hypothetical protein